VYINQISIGLVLTANNKLADIIKSKQNRKDNNKTKKEAGRMIK